MFNYFLNLFKNNDLIKNSVIFFIGTMIVNVGNYLYHLITARMLGVIEYGELQALLSVFLILGVPMATLSTLIVKYTANFKGENRFDKIYSLFKYFSKHLLLYGAIVFLLIVLLNKFIVSFLNLTQSFPVLILGGVLFISFIAVINKGILQGAQKFKEVSILGIVGILFKIIFTVLLITVGLSLNGAIGAIFLSAVVAYILSFWFIKFVFKYKTENVKFADNKMLSSSGIIFLTLFSLILLYTADVILVKHFLSPELAGQYSGLSILGRIIFFLSGAIVAVMFSMSSEAHKRAGGENEKILKQSLLIIAIISLLILFIYFLIPKFLIMALLGSKFLALTKYVGWFGLAMFFYSFINVLAQYFLSINQTKFVYILLSGVVLQIVLISCWHANIAQIVWIMNIVMMLVLFGFLIYYNKMKKTLKEKLIINK